MKSRKKEKRYMNVNEKSCCRWYSWSRSPLPHSGSLIRKHAKATAGRLHGFEIDKAENNRCQCPWSPQALPEKLIGRRGGANSKLCIYSCLPGRSSCLFPLLLRPRPRHNAPSTATSIGTLICFRDTNYRFVQSMKTTRHWISLLHY